MHLDRPGGSACTSLRSRRPPRGRVESRPERGIALLPSVHSARSTVRGAYSTTEPADRRRVRRSGSRRLESDGEIEAARPKASRGGAEQKGEDGPEAGDRLSARVPSPWPAWLGFNGGREGGESNDRLSAGVPNSLAGMVAAPVIETEPNTRCVRARKGLFCRRTQHAFGRPLSPSSSSASARRGSETSPAPRAIYVAPVSRAARHKCGEPRRRSESKRDDEGARATLTRLLAASPPAHRHLRPGTKS